MGNSPDRDGTGRSEHGIGSSPPSLDLPVGLPPALIYSRIDLTLMIIFKKILQKLALTA